MINKFFVSLILIATLLVKQTVAQDQTSSVSQDSTQTKYTPVPKIKQLIKAGIGLPMFRQSSVSPTWKTIGFGVTIEKKILNGLTVTGSLETNYGFSRYAQLYSLEFPIGLRYYFSLGRRMRKRGDRHSFFSHYVGFDTHNVVFANLYYDTPNPSIEHYYRGQHLNYDTNIGNYSEALNLVQFAYFKIGSQFRVARNNYLDINAAIPVSNITYNKTEYTLSTPAWITIKYGIIW